MAQIETIAVELGIFACGDDRAIITKRTNSFDVVERGKKSLTCISVKSVVTAVGDRNQVDWIIGRLSDLDEHVLLRWKDL